MTKFLDFTPRGQVPEERHKATKTLKNVLLQCSHKSSLCSTTQSIDSSSCCSGGGGGGEEID